MRAIMFSILLMMPACETVYHHNTVYQYDVVYDTAEFDTVEDIVFYCDNRLCNNQ
jgi:hypothetical protein